MADLVALPSSAVSILSDAERIFCEQVAKTNDPLKAWITSRVPVDPRFTREVQVERLLDLPRIKDAVAALRQIVPTKKPVRRTRDTLIEDFETIYDKAIDAGDLTNANKAKDSQARLMGMMVEKKEITVSNDPDKLSSADLKAFIAREIDKQQRGMIDVTPVKDDGGS